MSITADPLFVAAESQWRRERLTIAFQAPGVEGDDVLAPRHQQHEHHQARLRHLIVSRLPHRHGRAATAESGVATRAA